MKNLIMILSFLLIPLAAQSSDEASVFTAPAKDKWKCYAEGRDQNNFPIPFVAYGPTRNEASRRVLMQCSASGYTLCRPNGCFEL